MIHLQARAAERARATPDARRPPGRANGRVQGARKELALGRCTGWLNERGSLRPEVSACLAPKVAPRPRRRDAMVPVDRERTCPLLLRTFLNKGGHRRCASLSSRHSGAPHPLLAVPLPGKRSMRSGARSRLATRCRSTRGWTRRCGSSPTSSRRPARRRATGTASFRLRLFTQASTRKASWQSACTHARLASRANDGRSPPCR